MRILIALVLAVGVVASPTLPASAGSGDLSEASADGFVREYLAEHDLPAVGVAVVRGDRTVLAKGYGTTSDGAEVTPRTRFRIASLSKSMTAALVMRYAERGAIDLDAPVTKYLPEFRLDDPRYRDITVRHLLTQTSGMSDLTAHQDDDASTLAEQVRSMAGNGLAAAPGTAFAYHNPNYHLLARIVAVAAEQPFDQLLHDQVLEPAGMDQARSCLRSDSPSCDLPRGWIRGFGRDWTVTEPRIFFAGSGGVQASADDMAAWLRLHLNDGVAVDGTRLLSAASIKLMHTQRSDDAAYGMGWTARTFDNSGGAPQVWHGGSLTTACAYQVLVPSTGYGFAVLTDRGAQLSENAVWGLVDGLVALSEKRPGEDLPEPAAWPPFAALAVALGVAVFAARSVVRTVRVRRRGARRPRLLGTIGWAGLLGVVVAALPVYRLLIGRTASWQVYVLAAPEYMAALGVLGAAAAAVVVAQLVTIDTIREWLSPTKRSCTPKG